ncbi:hypothetical protein [Chitinophaga defluvii]|uniref:Uncharacterized protein n=1 Tax=Chitinophaga defluvii TaxID=3163343 RepID=A0ABV2T9Q3_9BACT
MITAQWTYATPGIVTVSALVSCLNVAAEDPPNVPLKLADATLPAFFNKKESIPIDAKN